MSNGLPPGMTARNSSSAVRHYYARLPGCRESRALGSDLTEALRLWQCLRIRQFLDKQCVEDYVALIDCYIFSAVPVRNEREQSVLLKQANTLRGYFVGLGKPGFEDDIPDAAAYITARGAGCMHRAGAEVHLLSHIWIWARNTAILAAHRPCPWNSKAVLANRRAAALDELVDAMAILCAQLTPPSRPDARDVSRHRAQMTSLLLGDGRQDLAGFVRSLDAIEYLAALTRASQTTPSKTLMPVLGKQRITQLKTMRAAIHGKKKSATTPG